MHIQVSVETGCVYFRFETPARLDMLAVSNAAEQVQWELKPSYMHLASMADGFMIGVAVPSRIADLIPRRNDIPSAEEEAVPLLSEVIYGIAPSGYREITTARTLEKGKAYAVLAFDDAGGSTVVQFSI